MNPPDSRSSSTTLWSRVLIAVALFTLVLVGWRTITQPDYWLHLASGYALVEDGALRSDALSFSAEGDKWINIHWLYDAMIYGIQAGFGHGGVTLLHLGAMIAAYACLLPVARRLGGTFSVPLAILLGIWIIRPNVEVVPGTFSVLFPALFLLLLQRVPSLPTRLSTLLPLQILWTNMSPGFLLGPLLAMAYTQEENRDGKATSNQHILLPVFTLLATLINPWGPRLLFHLPTSLTHTFTNLSYGTLSAFSQGGANSSSFSLYVSLVIAGGGLMSFRKRLPLTVTSLAILTAFVAVMTSLPPLFYGVLAMPFFALSLHSLGQWLAPILRPLLQALPSSLARGLSVAAVLLLSAATAFPHVTNRAYISNDHPAVFGLGAEETIFPRHASVLIEHPDFPDRAFNSPIDGGYLAWLYPDREIFLDTRVSLHGHALYAAWRKSLADPQSEEWQELLAQYNPGALILNANEPNVPAATLELLQGGPWRLAFFDGVTVILLRDTPDHQALLEDASIQARGLQAIETARAFYNQSQRKGIAPPLPVRLLGAGKFFTTLKRYPQAIDAYEPLIRILPENPVVWFNSGVAQFSQRNPEEALTAFRKATSLMPDNALAWIWLARCQSTQEDRGGAADSLRRARNLNPEVTARLSEQWGLSPSGAAPLNTPPPAP